MTNPTDSLIGKLEKIKRRFEAILPKTAGDFNSGWECQEGISELDEIIRQHSAAPDVVLSGLPGFVAFPLTTGAAIAAMGGVTAGEADSADSSASYRDNNPAPPAQTSEISVVDKDALFDELRKLGYSEMAAAAKVSELKRFVSAPKPVSVSLEAGAKALCRYEHGATNFDEAWASWHANFESLAEQVAMVWGLEYVD